jgi:hypothetical protein
MNDIIVERKKQRFIFLQRLYELTEGRYNKYLKALPIGEELGFSNEDTKAVVEYLTNERLIKVIGYSGDEVAICLLHEGAVEIETAFSEPEHSTQHFPPITIMNIEHMDNSQVQIATQNSSQIASSGFMDTQAINTFISNLRTQLSELELEPDKHQEAESEITTIQSQLTSPNPKPSIIKESLKSLRVILEGVAAGVLATGFLQVITNLLHQIP